MGNFNPSGLVSQLGPNMRDHRGPLLQTATHSLVITHTSVISQQVRTWQNPLPTTQQQETVTLFSREWLKCTLVQTEGGADLMARRPILRSFQDSSFGSALAQIVRYVPHTLAPSTSANALEHTLSLVPAALVTGDVVLWGLIHTHKNPARSADRRPAFGTDLNMALSNSMQLSSANIIHKGRVHSIDHGSPSFLGDDLFNVLHTSLERRSCPSTGLSPHVRMSLSLHVRCSCAASLRLICACSCRRSSSCLVVLI